MAILFRLMSLSLLWWIPALAVAVMQNNQWREEYRDRLRKLASVLRPVDLWTAKIDEQRERLKPMLESVNADQAAVHQDRINELKERLTQRAEALEDLIENGMLQLLEFHEEGIAVLTDWAANAEAEKAKLEEVDVEGVALFAGREGALKPCPHRLDEGLDSGRGSLFSACSTLHGQPVAEALPACPEAMPIPKSVA